MKFWSIRLTNLILFATATSQTTTQSDSGRRAAAEANLPFLTEFVNDISTNLPAYTSFMDSNSMVLPQELANYYFHVAQLPQTADLEEDVVSSFPFTHFKTFVTKFPWYGSLLERASASTVYVPQDFVSSATQTETTSPQSTTSSGAPVGANESGRTGSLNAASINKFHIALFLILCVLVL